MEREEVEVEVFHFSRERKKNSREIERESIAAIRFRASGMSFVRAAAPGAPTGGT
jgi:hypothetical protein